jgi:MFS family permease
MSLLSLFRSDRKPISLKKLTRLISSFRVACPLKNKERMSENTNLISTNLLNPTIALDTGVSAEQVTRTFKRDKFTWLSYSLLGYYSYLLALLGPVIAFLVIDFGLDYITSSLHFSAFALGMFLAGASGDRVNRLVGRSMTLWGGTLGMAVGTMLLVFSGTPGQSIAGVFLMGLLGSWLLVTVQSSLSDHHGHQRGIALTEANIIASIGSSLSAWVIGFAANTAFGWRFSLWLVGPVVLAFLLFFRGQSAPTLPSVRPASGSTVTTATFTASNTGKKRLPPIFWLFWLVGFLAVSTEWCVGFWGIDFLNKVGGFSKSDSALVMGLYFVIMVFSRIIVSRLIRHFPANILLPLSAAFILVGFPAFWLAPDPVISILSLLFMGLGIANLVPLNVPTAISLAPAQADLISARLISASGLALLISPFVLGWLADLVGIQQAFGLILILATSMFGLMLVGYFKTRKAAKAG